MRLTRGSGSYASGDREADMRSILPLVLLSFFAVGLFLAVALVQREKNQANQDYMAEEADIEEIRNEIIESYMWVDSKDRQEKFARRMKNLEARHEQAVKQRDAAFAAAYSRQGYIIWAGVVLFIVFVAVTLYMGRKSADGPPAG
jgi:hypothetical protein